ncbi:MAG: flagellar hook-length control protein FliK [Eubacterium sp.]|nr:flagellar hook-length control protein FliK [Eubacterium sp.]
MPISSNSVHNNQNQSGSMNTASAKRTFRSGGGTITVREGETLKGVVSDIHGNEITISMEDGSSFTGKLPEASQYSIGQKAAFQITGLDGGTIYMKAISQAYLLGIEDTIEQALEEAGLPKSPRNLEIVRSLLLNQQSISRENIAESLQLCAKYPNADVNSVITMKRLGMPMDMATVTQFDQYNKQTHQLLTRMDALADSINELLTELAKENPSIARYATGEVLDMVLQSLPSLEEQNLTATQLQANLSAAPGTEAAEGADLLPGEENQEIPPEATEDTQAAGQTATSPFARMKQLLNGITDRASSPAGAEAKPTEFIPEQTGHLLTAEERSALSDLLGKYTENKEVLTALEKGDLTARELLTNIKDTLTTLPDEELHRLVSQKAFQKVIKGQFLSGWTLSPEGLKEEGSIDTLYNRMQQQFSDLTNLSRMFATRNSGEQIINTTSDLQQNLAFMKMLNEQFAYMQLPLKLSQQNAHGDLYVMTRKNALKKSKDNLKVLLHLEMDSLGTLDIHITKDHTSISTQFYTAKETARKLLEKNVELLKDAINEQGYSFTSEFLAKEKDIDLVHDFIEKDSPAPPAAVKRYNFDLRA